MGELTYYAPLPKCGFVSNSREVAMEEGARTRGERLQIMLTPEELILIDDFRFKHRMPSRAAAVREILTRGLSALGFAVPLQDLHSSEFGVTDDRQQDT
jgi:hypothetical protein